MENRPQDDGPKQRPFYRGINFWLMLFALTGLLVILYFWAFPQETKISKDFLVDQIKEDNIASLKIATEGSDASGTFRDGAVSKAQKKFREQFATSDAERKMIFKEDFRVVIPTQGDDRNDLVELVNEHNRQAEAEPDRGRIDFQYVEPSSGYQTLFLMLLIMIPIGFILFMWLSYRRTRNEILGGGFLSGFTKSPAKRYEATKQPTTFKDVAGLDGVKADLMEIVDYLKSPEKFQKLGGRVPKGVLLNGPPGTGKTLLARAVAGEAEVPFYSVSGSEFIQMFVGVGASRVRDLFATAKENAPAIIFVDEIDAVGRQRGAGLGGGHDEREQTLNQILSEMDGFTRNDSAIVMAATNRPDVLDPALLRPGRFDRHITVDRPTKKGRLEIFKVHVRDVPLDDKVDLERLAAGTAGLTGADIRNIVNEAALWAARQNQSKVEMNDFDYAMDKIQMGAKREEVLSDEEKKKTAYHEAGHTILAWLTPGGHPVHKVTIIPRGRALGVTQVRPDEDRFNMSEKELRSHLMMLLGGRAAEQLVFAEITVGAENDLERATGLARRMVTHWGMSERLGPVSYKMSNEDPFLGREIHQGRQFSEHTMELIDEEVARILHDTLECALATLTANRDKLEHLANSLLEKEELDEREIRELIGPSVHKRAESNGKPAGEARPAGEPSKDGQRSPAPAESK